MAGVSSGQDARNHKLIFASDVAELVSDCVAIRVSAPVVELMAYRVSPVARRRSRRSPSAVTTIPRVPLDRVVLADNTRELVVAV